MIETREEFCVMTPSGPHPAYGPKASLAEAQSALDFDGGSDLTIARRTRTITTTDWRPVEPYVDRSCCCGPETIAVECPEHGFAL